MMGAIWMLVASISQHYSKIHSKFIQQDHLEDE